MLALFAENVCENERIGSCKAGACAGKFCMKIRQCLLCSKLLKLTVPMQGLLLNIANVTFKHAVSKETLAIIMVPFQYLHESPI